jgi:hypothetical protein
MNTGKLYRVTKELILHKEDFEKIKVDDWNSVEALSAIASRDGTKRRVTPPSIQKLQELNAMYGLDMKDIAEIFSSSSCMVPVNSVVLFVETSQRTGNFKLVFEEFIGWTDLLSDNGLFVEVPSDAEG